MKRGKRAETQQWIRIFILEIVSHKGEMLLPWKQMLKWEKAEGQTFFPAEPVETITEVINT